MADVNRYYVVDQATWVDAQATLTKRVGRGNSWEILQDRPSLDSQWHLIQAVTSDQEHSRIMRNSTAQYLGDFHPETGQADPSVTEYIEANPQLWGSRIP